MIIILGMGLRNLSYVAFILVLITTIYLISAQIGLAVFETDSWITKASMPKANAAFEAVVVDGKIYAIGGVSGANAVYDPASDTWTTKASPPTQRTAFSIGVMQNKIYCIGGLSGVNEVYDIATDTWNTETAMPTPRRVIDAHVVNDKIYFIGGETNDLSLVNVNEAYNPATDTWTTKTPLPTLRLAPCTHVVDGKIYVIGGRDAYIAGGTTYGSVFDANEVYDPATDTWATKTPMPAPDEGYLSAVLDDRIYVFGKNATYIYDTQTDNWTSGTTIPTYQFGETVTTSGVLALKKIYIIGGYTNPYSNSDIFTRTTNLTQIYDPKTDMWSLGSAMPTPRTALSVVNVDDAFYAIGGSDIIPHTIGVLSSPKDTNEQYLPIGYGTPDPSYISPTNSPNSTSNQQPTAFQIEPVYVLAGVLAAATIIAATAVNLKRKHNQPQPKLALKMNKTYSLFQEK
jgi:N-acetylneuraminic acid mutarotase